jgi:hypothetical protein
VLKIKNKIKVKYLFIGLMQKPGKKNETTKTLMNNID